ncbi:small G protein signaling modulator 2-like [Amphiura filiformis]|uniref:small G protein signaling modulator 2-like n=1 Tax=Amphiura filiformis TaxID=82378 RepID=UPI003B219490
MDHPAVEKEFREKLLRSVKKEVKQIMEEAVTRKFVHEDSGSIISLCVAVDSCLVHGLKRRAVGIFKGNNTTASLLKQVSKNYTPAAQVSQKVHEIETRMESRKKMMTMNGDSPNRPGNSIRVALQLRNLWIRVALFEKELSKIIEYITQNYSKYYDKDALLADPVEGPILASLLVGPCALDYSKMKTADHYWTDPPADELVQRHRIHSGGPRSVDGQGPNSPKRPGLQVRKTPPSSTPSEEHRAPMSARDYVESLHQNNRSQLLYGKNNVFVQPKEDIQQIPGYLSLHQTHEHLTIKWTPNQLMNGGGSEGDENEGDKSPKSPKTISPRLNGRIVVYWDYAVAVNVEDVVYLHCHQQPDSGGTLVLVGQDGVQHPPIHFPKGGHLLAFLTCLENGLLPRGQLDPPLWSQRGKGKVLPKLRRKTSAQAKSGSMSMEKDGTQIFEGEEATDYVFRIINSFKPEFVPEEAIDPRKTKANGLASLPWLIKDLAPRHVLIRQEEINHSPTKTTRSIYSPGTPSPVDCVNMSMIAANATSRSSIKLLCDTMRKQIISRAFYGWLAHCRHLRTVRTHLSGLVHPVIITKEGQLSAKNGLTEERWHQLFENEMITDEAEVMKLVYFGGVQHEIRKEVWPYLLGHYKFGSTADDRCSIDEGVRLTYEQVVAEWMAVEAIIRQREKDNQMAKFSSENSSEGQIPLTGRDPSLDSEVFEIEEDNDDYIESGEVREMSELTSEQMTIEQREFVQKEDYLVFECRKSRQDTLESEMGRSMSEASVDRADVVTGKETPQGSPPSDEGFGDSTSLNLSVGRQSTSSAKDVISAKDQITQDDDATPAASTLEGDVVLERTGARNSITVELINGKGSTSHEKEDADEEEEEDETGDHLRGLNIPDSVSLLSAESATASPASSNGGVYSTELLDTFSLNLHRVDKDVQRCDRNYAYFNMGNLEKLRNVMCSYVWEHLDVGYVQGMCDLVAPLLVIFDDEAKTYSCFCELMKRMSKNFPHGGAMDNHFANMRSLIQILDSEMFELMHQNGDYTHFYFCYRWFLLDFKRALALVEYYRDIILDNNMDFTDIIKFFNEMAEHHEAKDVLQVARDLVHRVQSLIENK